ncbi:MAG: LPXTG cell wall anchor domain-containing protein, partial [Oscillospiraceae bacterium]|nr:LPXTG cell wall anchor domain-containing protein [Oscillospiraceae bacterium]
DTVVLYPVFGHKKPASQPLDPDRTSIILDANGGHEVANFTLPENGIWHEGALVLYVEDLQVNAAVTLPIDPVYEMEDPNVEFLGWAYTPTARLPDFLAGETVGVDNEAGNGYQGNGVNYLYAVWHLKSVSFQIQKVSAADETPLAGALFSLEYPEEQGRDAKEMRSGDDGYLRFPDQEITEITVQLPTSMDPEEAYVYTLTETAPPEGYLPLTEALRIAVSFDGSVTCAGELDYALSEKGEDGVYTLTIRNRPDGETDLPGLPDTGGPGSVGATALGVLLMAAAALLLRIRGKQRG